MHKLTEKEKEERKEAGFIKSSWLSWYEIEIWRGDNGKFYAQILTEDGDWEHTTEDYDTPDEADAAACIWLGY